MNLIDVWVTGILSDVYQKYGKFWVKVSYVDEGGEGETELMFDSIQEALQVKIDYKFLH
ncbi:hypothetical protein [Parabacteroides sp.]